MLLTFDQNMYKTTVMPFSYNLNTYSRNTLEQWLSVLYRDLYLSEEFQSFFEKEKMVLHNELNPLPGYLKLASGDFFNPEKDFFYPLPGELMQVLACGIHSRKVLATAYGYKTSNLGDNIFSPVHFYNEEMHLMPVSGQQGYHAAIAAGAARSLKLYKTEGIALCNLSAADLCSGPVYEALISCDSERLPVVFYVHGYEEGQTTANPDIFGRLKNTYLSYCDNTNLFDSVNAARKATRLARDESLPVILIARGTLTSEQVFDSYTDLLIQSGKYEKNEIRAFGDRVQAEIKKSISLVQGFDATPPAQLIRKTIKVTEAKEQQPEKHTAPVTLIDAIKGAISAQLLQFRHSFVLTPAHNQADDVLQHLIARNASQVIELPFASGFLVSSAAGMNHYKEKLRSIIRLPMSGTALSEAISHITELAFLSWKSQLNVNMLITMPVSGYDGSGPFRSHKPDTMLMSVPGIRVLYPSFADDAAGLLRTAFKSPGITVFLESNALYHDQLSAAAVHPEHEVMTGKSRLLREGHDITIIAWGNATHLALKASHTLAKEYNFQAEVIDLRSLLPLDKTAILRSIRKTRRAIVVSEGYLFANTAADIAAMAGREAFTSLVAPVGRVGALFTPIPYQLEAETMALPSVNRIVDEALDILEY